MLLKQAEIFYPASPVKDSVANLKWVSIVQKVGYHVTLDIILFIDWHNIPVVITAIHKSVQTLVCTSTPDQEEVIMKYLL